MQLCTLLVAALATHGAPSVAPIALGNLALYADTIVVGQVVRAICVGEGGEMTPSSRGTDGSATCDEARTIAEVVVERVLRGDPETTRVWYFAEGTWICDITQAVPGERALFFLSHPSREARTEKQQGAELELTGGQPVLRVAWAGRGRMPIKIEDGQQLITAWDDVVPPTNFPSQPARDIPYASIYWIARLEDMVEFIQARISSFNPMPAHPGSGVPACIALTTENDRVVAAFWRDGTVVWSDDRVAGGPPYWQGNTGAESVSALGEMWVEGRLQAMPASKPDLNFPGCRVTLLFPGACQELRFDGQGVPDRNLVQLRKQLLGAIPEHGGVRLGDPLVTR